MEQPILTNTEENPKEAKDLGVQVTLENFNETFRALQKKLDDEHQLTLELQRKLKIEQQLNRDLQAKLDDEQQLRTEQTNELISELRKALDERNSIKSVLTKKRDILQLKCQRLEQCVGILQSAEKARQESSHEKGDPKTDAGLKKLGLTENILLALPFGYATKVRSAFEKLSYENEKLKEMVDQTEQPSTDQGQLESLSRENAELLKKNVTQAREIEQLKRESSSLYEVLKNSAALSSLNSLETQRRGNSDPLKETEQGLSYDELKIRCGLLAQINTMAMLNGRLRTSQPDSSVASTSPTLNDQNWS